MVYLSHARYHAGHLEGLSTWAWEGVFPVDEALSLRHTDLSLAPAKCVTMDSDSTCLNLSLLTHEMGIIVMVPTSQMRIQ